MVVSGRRVKKKKLAEAMGTGVRGIKTTGQKSKGISQKKKKKD